MNHVHSDFKSFYGSTPLSIEPFKPGLGFEPDLEGVDLVNWFQIEALALLLRPASESFSTDQKGLGSFLFIESQTMF